MTPEDLNAFAYPEGSVAPTIALDATGLTVFDISKSGLTVIKLPATRQYGAGAMANPAGLKPKPPRVAWVVEVADFSNASRCDVPQSAQKSFIRKVAGSESK